MRIAIIATVALAGPAFAQPNATAFRDCGKIADSVKRLACFDGLTAATAPAPAALPQPENKGDWQVVSGVSKIDDTANVILSLDSVEEIEGVLAVKAI